MFDALARDEALVSFLAAQADTHNLPIRRRRSRRFNGTSKSGSLRDTLAHRPKIESNYPSTDITLTTMQTVLGWPGNRDEVLAMLDQIIAQATAVDGLSGEKGLFGYATIAPRTVAGLLGRYAGWIRSSWPRCCSDIRQLHAMYRFHIDTWCLGKYYPCTGDTGAFAQQCAILCGPGLSRGLSLEPSAFTFLWDLFSVTGDRDFVRVLYAGNGQSTEGLPYDLFADDPAEFQQRVAH